MVEIKGKDGGGLVHTFGKPEPLKIKTMPEDLRQKALQERCVFSTGKKLRRGCRARELQPMMS